MQFSFSKKEYKWCSHCAGNIKSASHWCRFCQRELTNDEFAGLRKSSVRANLDLVQAWLPAFNVLRNRLDADFQERFLESHGQTHIEQLIDNAPIKEANQEVLKKLEHWPDAPPSAAVTALLLDILVALASSGADLEGICQEPRLQVLGLSAPMVETELALRKEESAGASTCPFCAESVITDVQSCRHCLSLIGDQMERNIQPAAYLEKQPFDGSFLRDVILHLAARHNLLGFAPDLRLLDALEANHIDADAVKAESARLSNLRKDELEVSRPLSRFRHRFYEFNACAEDPIAIEIKDLLDLGSCCRQQKRYFEAELVFNHALARASASDDGPRDMRSDALHELSYLYLDVGDFEKAFSIMHERAELIGAKHPNLRGVLFMDVSIRGRFDMYFQIGQPEIPDLNATLKEYDRLLEEGKTVKPHPFQSMLGIATPGYQDRFAIYEDARQTVLAQIHIQNEEYDQAQKVIRSLLTRLGHEWTHNKYRLRCWLQLAEIYERQGHIEECEEAYKEALEAGHQMALKSPSRTMYGTRDACRAAALYLKKTSRLAESRQYMRKAIEANAEMIEYCRLKFGHPVACSGFTTAALLRDYADVLKISAEHEEAETISRQAEALTAQYELLKEKWLSMRGALESRDSPNP